MAGNKRLVDPRLYKLLVEQAKDYALFLLDRDGRIMSWNAGAQRLKGYSAEEIVGRHFSTFYTREAVDRGWPQHELKIATAEGRFEDEGWRVRKDGSRFWANVVITALRDEEGRPLGFSKITRDLTDRKLHEEALRQSEERFRLLIEGVVDYAIFMLDTDGVVTSWNAGAERIKGYKRDEIIGKHLSRFFLPEDIEAGKPWEELAAARRDGRAESEGWRVRKNGERFWARAVLSALYDATGHLRGFAKVTQDLTDRRHLQDLEQATKNVNEFIATLAHELRNPLAPIRTAVQVMAKAPANDPAQETMRQTIERQSAQLARIVNDMIDISRITRGAIAIEHAPVDVADVARRAAEAAAPLIDGAGHKLHMELPGEPCWVNGDLHRLTQLATNLLNNAARYTPQGGDILLAVRAAGSQVRLQVRDNGRGIEPELLERIFDMFVQGRPPLKRVAGGLGIGLALSRKIAELHGGSLDARSDGPGKGSEFTLRLPAAKLEERRSGQDAGISFASGGPQRILVVDDNVDAARSLEMLLKSLGHETLVVHDGAEALRAAPEYRPSIVLLDIGMPGLDGYEVARRLRAMEGGESLRIVAVTGWGQDADREKSREAGFDLHLVKPVEPRELVRVLDERGGASLH
ncbi:MAG TPA: PAS domain S-box protein [Burkholderiales bacterium]|nr:PAS domain S-box protein [Burkholderiales bacterium]